MKISWFFLLSSVFGLLLSGCSSDDNASLDGPSVVILYAGYNSDDGFSTRTTLDSYGNIKWSAADAINVNGETSTQTLLSDGGTGASFTVTASPPYYAMYPPYSGAVFNSDKTFSITFPSEQTYKDAVSFSDGANLSVAVSSTQDLSFYNVCGVAKAQITADATVNLTNIRKIRFLSADKAVAGAAIVNPSNKSMNITGSTKSMDVTFSSDQTLTSSSSLTIRWVLPTGTYAAGWKIELLDMGNNVLLRKIAKGPLTIARAKITSVGTLIYTSNH